MALPSTPPHQTNLLSSLPCSGISEASRILLAGKGLRLEHIVSHGHASPEGFWYDQKEAEWVIVLSGRAGLAIEGEPSERVLNPGDAVYLPARCRHRVTWTEAEVPTVWLALFVASTLDPSIQAEENIRSTG